MSSLTWHVKVSNLSVLRESFYKYAYYFEILSTSTILCLDFIAMCHVNGINVCCHDS
jgi:hypothetical protein